MIGVTVSTLLSWIVELCSPCDLQFSKVPWDFTDDNISQISRNWCKYLL